MYMLCAHSARSMHLAAPFPFRFNTLALGAFLAHHFCSSDACLSSNILVLSKIQVSVHALLFSFVIFLSSYFLLLSLYYEQS